MSVRGGSAAVEQRRGTASVEPLEALLAEQDADGWFLSTVLDGDVTRPDRNGFTTALVLRAIRHVRLDEPSSAARVAAVRRRALDCLERCASGRMPSAFCFWPEDQRPGWFPGNLPPDLDDTAVQAIELARGGRLTPSQLRECAVRACTAARRIRLAPARPRWIVPGAFRTWLGVAGHCPVVDATVNANAVALLAATETKDLPGYAEACETLRRGVTYAGASTARARSLSPYYATPMELAEAVEHAVACGASELEPLRDRIRRTPWGANRPAAGSPRFRIAYGSLAWITPAVHHARALRRLHQIRSRARLREPTR